MNSDSATPFRHNEGSTTSSFRLLPSSFKPYPAYKPSGIEWLGEIPEHWEVKRLKLVAHINDDVLSEATDPSYELRYLDIGNVNDRGQILAIDEISFEAAPSRARRVVRAGDTIISTVRTYLKAIGFLEAPEPNLIVSTGFAVLRPKSILNSKFLFWLVSSPNFVDAVVSHSEGVGYPAINPATLAALPMWYPDVTQQRAIANFLDLETAEIDALIAKKERLVELLQEKRTALISHAVTKGLDPTVPMKDSGIEWLGEIPDHWEVKQLKYVVSKGPASIKTGPFGSQLLADEMVGGEVKVYNQRNVIDKDSDVGDNYILKNKYRELASFAVEPGNILVTTRGTIGRCFILPPGAEKGILHPCLMRIRPDENQYLPELLSIVIEESYLFQTQLFLLSNATTIEVIYSDTIKRVLLPVPSQHEQARILNYIRQQAEKIDTLVAKIRDAIERLKEYRTALISAAVTGKIDVRKQA
jgi:type I restriction enzyme S subunit